MEEKPTKTKKFPIGYKNRNKFDREYEVIEIISTVKRRIRFIESGCEKVVHTKSIYDNAIKDDGYKQTSKYKLHNKQFGEWTVIGETPFNKNAKPYWKCKCSCGSIKDVAQSSLINGSSTKCKECKSKLMFKDDKYIGKYFGEIYVIDIDKDYYNEKKRRKYICKCSCGYEFSSFPHNLVNLNKCKFCKEKEKSIVGKTYKRLYIADEFKTDEGWKCVCYCSCGNEVVARKGDILSGKTKSCGCLVPEMASQRLKTHGLTNTRIHNIWSAMKQRCYYTKSSHYQSYGAKGIKVCDEWKDNFMNFYNWAINNGYKDNLSIDRIDVNGDYEPTNCRWATNEEQANNKTTNRYITYKGETKTLSEWAKELGKNYSTLRTQTKKYTLDEIMGDNKDESK